MFLLFVGDWNLKMTEDARKTKKEGELIEP